MTAIASPLPSSRLTVTLEGGRAVLAGNLDVATVTEDLAPAPVDAPNSTGKKEP